MHHRSIAAVIFYDDQKNVYLQKRGAHSKVGEEYGFWGGGVEDNETPDQALVREVKEELGLDLKDYQFFKTFHADVDDLHIDLHIFTAPVDFDYTKLPISEGAGFLIQPLDDMLSRPQDFDSYDHQILSGFKTHMGW